jgi:hypothetical protein
VRALLFRTLLLLTVLASLFVRFHGLRDNQEMAAVFNVDDAIRETIHERGFAMLENTARPHSALAEAIYFKRPACADASWVVPYALSSEELLYLKQFVRPDFDKRYIYLDREWIVQDRLAMYFVWAKNMFLGGVGGARYFTEKKALFVAEPADCDKSVAIDWRRVWSRDRRRDS